MSLGIDCARIKREVGRMLGLSRDPADWSAQSAQDVWDIIDSGLACFYVPPRAPGERKAHQWSFLRPIGTIDFEVDTNEYDMPANYAGADGPIFYVPNNDTLVPTQIFTTSEAVILQRQSLDHYSEMSSCPTLAAIRPASSVTTEQQIYKMLVWPTPSMEATVKFKYFARQPEIRDDDAVPMGGDEHAETILASCLSVAETRLNDESTLYRDQFAQRLQASIDHDRAKNAADTLGYYGDRSSRITGETYFRTSNLIDYEGWNS